MMRIGILRIGQVEESVAIRIQESLDTIFANTKTELIPETMPLPKEAYSNARKQYRSDTILSILGSFRSAHNSFDRILGIVDVDLFVPRLNFVFGEAVCSGNVAVISLWRLRPEFYGKTSNDQILVERGIKEAAHELGHTMGLKHCNNPFCVMHFSNSIFDTDRKQTLFCNKCSLKIGAIGGKGKDVEGRV